MRHFEFSLANNFQPMAFLCGMGHFCTDASNSKEDDDADDADDGDADDDADDDGAVVMITKLDQSKEDSLQRELPPLRKAYYTILER